MVYDNEKYRAKREKVLGINQQGFKFQTLALIVICTILSGFAFASLPEAVSYLGTRNLDDAIYKLDGTVFQDAMMEKIEAIKGVAFITRDKHGSRLVITFDRRVAEISDFDLLFNRINLRAVLLNRVNHRQRRAVLEKEEQFETP